MDKYTKEINLYRNVEHICKQNKNNIMIRWVELKTTVMLNLSTLGKSWDKNRIC